MSHPRRFLVTGGAGFIGSNFVRYVLAQHPDDAVTVLDKLTYAGNRETLAAFDGDRRFRFVRGDIADPAAAAPLVASCDVLVNFAAESHVDRSIVDPTAFLQTNVIGTQVLLDAARRVTPRPPLFVQISTDEVYGSTDGAAFREDSPLHPNSPYAASKTAADLLVQAYAATFGMPTVVTRSSNNYGPHQYPEKFIPLAITHALADEPIPLYGDGLQVRDWLHVEDNCRAIDRAIGCVAQADPRHTKVFNIGGGEGAEVTNRRVLETILRLLGKPLSLIRRVADRPGHDRRYALSAERLQRACGWRPERRFEEGLRQTIDWYRTHESWWRPLKDRAAPHWLTTKGASCAS